MWRKRNKKIKGTWKGKVTHTHTHTHTQKHSFRIMLWGSSSELKMEKSSLKSRHFSHQYDRNEVPWWNSFQYNAFSTSSFHHSRCCQEYKKVMVHLIEKLESPSISQFSHTRPTLSLKEYHNLDSFVQWATWNQEKLQAHSHFPFRRFRPAPDHRDSPQNLPFSRSDRQPCLFFLIRPHGRLRERILSWLLSILVSCSRVCSHLFSLSSLHYEEVHLFACREQTIFQCRICVHKWRACMFMICRSSHNNYNNDD